MLTLNVQELFCPDIETRFSPPVNFEGVFPDACRGIQIKNEIGSLLFEVPAGVHKLRYVRGFPGHAGFPDRTPRDYLLSFPDLLFEVVFNVGCLKGIMTYSRNCELLYFVNNRSSNWFELARNNLPNSDHPYVCWHVPLIVETDLERFVDRVIKEVKTAFFGALFNDSRGFFIRHESPMITYCMKDGSLIDAAGFAGWQNESVKDPHFGEKVDWLKTNGRAQFMAFRLK